ncbi:MAG TPA: flagellar basal body L-ring protein FlgH [Syntrophales bacterium]|nr:flagellar basal body L-ring protein FlgH [Syntrophales bacterium]
MIKTIKMINVDAYPWRLLIMEWVALFFIVAGCSSRMGVVKAQEPIPVPPEAAAANPRPGSIWPGESTKNMLFADNKARYVNDIVTVIISESSTGTSTATTNTSRDSTTTTGIAALLGIEKSIAERNANLTDENLEPKIGIGGTASNSLKGKGDTARGSKLTTRLTARVVKALDNGTLFIEGRRQLTMNAEAEYIVLSGIIRPEDITTDNMIASQNISDAKIYYMGKGVINDKMRPGWLTRITDWVWPF